MLFPLVKILTPNIYEASYYSNIDLKDITLQNLLELKKAANIILEKIYGNSNKYKVEKAVVIKNALKTKEKVIDFALINKKTEKGLEKSFRTYEKRKIELMGNIQGTGCVFSSALTSFSFAKSHKSREYSLIPLPFFTIRSNILSIDFS